MERLDDAAITAALQGSPWERRGHTLVREVTLRDFASALAFVNQVGERAEARGHHPDISISWNRVKLTLWTHSAGGLTRADLDLAGDIDGIEVGPDPL
ncbi:MAG: 4a-hydroxytetrahydrobiopterin dehydratase [Acidimicrobiales bacterium]